MKRVLIITYYWPPSGGAGVQRWLKFVKYLRSFNWEPIVFTVENGEFPVLDFDLIKEIPDGLEVLKVPAWEPYKMYKLFSGKNKNEGINSGFLSEKKGSSFVENISKWIMLPSVSDLKILLGKKFTSWLRLSVNILSSISFNNIGS